MPVDPRLSLALAEPQQQGPSVMDMAARALDMRSSLQQQRAREMGMRQAEMGMRQAQEEEQNTIRIKGIMDRLKDHPLGPDGSTSLERQGALGDLSVASPDLFIKISNNDLSRQERIIAEEERDLRDKRLLTSKFSARMVPLMNKVESRNPSHQDLLNHWNAFTFHLADLGEGKEAVELREGILSSYGPPPTDPDELEKWKAGVMAFRGTLQTAEEAFQAQANKINQNKNTINSRQEDRRTEERKEKRNYEKGVFQNYANRHGMRVIDMTLADKALALRDFPKTLSEEQRQERANEVLYKHRTTTRSIKSFFQEQRSQALRKLEEALILDSEYEEIIKNINASERNELELEKLILNNRMAPLNPGFGSTPIGEEVLGVSKGALGEGEVFVSVVSPHSSLAGDNSSIEELMVSTGLEARRLILTEINFKTRRLATIESDIKHQRSILNPPGTEATIKGWRDQGEYSAAVKRITSLQEEKKRKEQRLSDLKATLRRLGGSENGKGKTTAFPAYTLPKELRNVWGL